MTALLAVPRVLLGLVVRTWRDADDLVEALERGRRDAEARRRRLDLVVLDGGAP